MFKKRIIVVSLLLIGLTSCIQITDDLTINTDGSGSLKYVINLSENKVKVNSILALDSIKGKKVPTILEIQTKINEFKKDLEKQVGISNVKVESDFTNFIFKLSFSFTSVNTLQDAVKTVIRSVSNDKKTPELDAIWLKWDGQKLERSIPEITVKKSKEFKPADIAEMKKGSYISITRFSKTIEKCSNPASIIAKNNLAVMLKTNPYLLTQNPKLLKNTIYLNSNKN